MADTQHTRGTPDWTRWLVFLAISFVCFAQYFIYDSITPLGTRMKDELGLSGAQYGLLFTYYAVPNVFFGLVLLAGVLVDKLGLKLSGILYTSLCVAGAVLTALGCSSSLPSILGGGVYDWLKTGFLPEYSPELKIMLLGRLVYGTGAEAILIVNNKVLARWFQGKELAFAYGLNLTVMRLGTFLALTTQAPIANAHGLSWALWFAAGVMATGLLAFFAYLAANDVAKRRRAPAKPATPAADGAPAEVFVWRDIFRFDARFWFVTVLCFCFYSAVFPFQSYAPDILVNKFGLSDARAGFYTSSLIIGTMICTPIFGFYVDKRGKRATMMMLGSLLIVPCFLALAYTHVWPIAPIFLIGVALSLVPAALWASIPMMVPEVRLGTAFGVIGYLQNVGLMAFPWIAGKIADANTTTQIVAVEPGSVPVGPIGQAAHAALAGVRAITGTDKVSSASVDYTQTLLLFSTLGVVAMVFAILLKGADAKVKTGFSIEKASRERAA